MIALILARLVTNYFDFDDDDGDRACVSQNSNCDELSEWAVHNS